MAIMIPDRPPTKATKSELEIFELIRNSERSADYFCLSSVGLARHQRKDFGEADFVVVGPLGVYCLEVKGGNVRRKDGLWEIGWPGKSYTSSEGPFKQAQSCRWPLIREVNDRLKLDLRRLCVVGWGVLFPDIVFDLRDPEWSHDVIYDQRDRTSSFVKYLERLESFSRSRIAQTGLTQPDRLTAQRARQIVQTFRGDFDLVPSLAVSIGDSSRELVSLSDQQFSVLDYALNERNERLICDGPAGSGKTLIAVEAAKRISRSGKSVLYLCYNKNLARFLRRNTSHDEGRLSISHVHGFFDEVLSDAGMLEQRREAAANDDVFLNTYPRLFEDACQVLIANDELPQFDFLVLDEAQDFLTRNILDALSLILDGGLGGKWAMFLDSTVQSLMFNRVDQLVLGHLEAAATYLTLRDNYRNPRSVVREVAAVTRTPLQQSKRKFDSPVEYITFSGQSNQTRRLENLLNQILSQGVLPDQISLLSPRKDSESCSAQLPAALRSQICFLRDSPDGCSNAIIASSISAYKGLENEVVVLTDLPRLDGITPWQLSNLYVGMTRARTRLYALVDNQFLTDRYATPD